MPLAPLLPVPIEFGPDAFTQIDETVVIDDKPILIPFCRFHDKSIDRSPFFFECDSMAQRKKLFSGAYELLLDSLGPSRWWPARTPFEVVVGAILTQNTSWKNVKKAIASLDEKGLLAPDRLHRAKRDTIARAIRSSGYYNQKAIKLAAFLDWFAPFDFSFAKAQSSFAKRSDVLRNELLGIHGIGPETADSILCYAFELPFFVVDAYTLRWYGRYTGDETPVKYHEMQRMIVSEFQNTWDAKQLTKHYNEFHALIVRLSYSICAKRKMQCRECPLRRRCHSAKQAIR